MPSTKTILIVDDEEIVRRLVCIALHGSACEDVLEADSATSAWEISREHPGPIHLLVSDVVMPGEMNGADLAMKVGDARPETKVLLMSGYDDLALEMKRGWHFIRKPFAPTELRERVQTILEHRV